MRQLSAHNLLCDCQYGFQKDHSTGDILDFLTESWSLSVRDFEETFAVGLDISKALDRVWHKSLISKLPSNRFYHSLCTIISSFLSIVMDSKKFSPKTINSGVPPSFVLSRTLFLLFINDLLNMTQCPIHAYADDTTLHFSTSYNRRPIQQVLSDSRRDAIGCLTSDLSLVSDCGRANLVLFNASKIQFLQLSIQHNLPDNYPLFFNDIQLSLSSTLNTLGLSFTKYLNW